MSDSEWRVKRSGTTSGTTSDKELQRVTANDNEWQQMKTSGTESHSKLQRVTTNDNDWQRMTKSGTATKKDTFTSKNGWLQFFL